MRIRRKQNNCPNCGASLDSTYNYCPRCGQENNDNNVSLSTLISDFFSTYFAVDGRFSKTIAPFLLKPGKLTVKYITGKRMTYAHPLRLYLLMSIFYFFMFSLVGHRVVEKEESNKKELDKTLNDIGTLDKQSIKEITSLLPQNVIEKINDDIEEDDLQELQRAFINNTSADDKRKLMASLDTTTLKLIGLYGLDSTQIARSTNNFNYHIGIEKQEGNEETTDNDSSEFILGRLDWGLIEDLKHNENYSDRQVLDSMHLTGLSAFEDHVAIQAIRISRASKKEVAGYVLSNLPLMMLVLIPVFALLLKVFYIRHKDFLYIRHLIHALHLHSFAYLLYGVTIALMLYIFGDTILGNLIGFGSFIIVSTYAFISFLRVYKQGWLKTLVKFNTVGVIYLGFIFFFFLGEMLVSILLF